MELNFLGGAGEVGRSAVLVRDGVNLLLDYGVKLDGDTTYPLEAQMPDALVVSHSHLDHSGFAPSLYAHHTPIAYGTAPTIELSKLLIEDSIRICRKKNQKPKFSMNSLKKFERACMPLGYGMSAELDGLEITLHDAGHTCGSAITEVVKSRTGKRLVYTGDFKLEPQQLQSGAAVVESDVLLIESTYADREHPDRSELVRSFIEDIKTVLDNGGTALLPVFAVGRAQEMLAILYKNGLITRTSIDGMAQHATEITMRYPDFSSDRDLLLAATRNVRWVGPDQSRTDTLSEPGIIVTTAGMLNGGPVLSYITALNNKSKVFITGYQVEGTNGRKLLDGQPLSVDGRKHMVRNPVAYYDFSAHAGRSELYDYVRRSGPETVICMHGESATAKSFAENLRIEGFDAHAPEMGDVVHVDF